MGWLWSSSKADAAPSKPSDERAGLSDEQRKRIFGPRESYSGDVQADKDLEAFLNSLASEESTPPSTIKPAAAPSQPAPSPAVEDPAPLHSRLLPDGSVNIDPAALHPRSMSCRSAFDQAFYCQSLGGKFNDIYRYGHLQPCSEQWAAFWFCMRTRALPTAEREARVSEYYAQREARKVREVGGSSEDVWELRTEGVRKAFHVDPYADEQGGDKKS